MKRRRALVLGGGPAGLLAAHAATQCDFDVTILAKTPRPSPMYGAQYLHADIPGIDCGEPVKVKYSLDGSAEQYAKKVGYDSDTRPSVEVLTSSHLAWDIRMAYANLRRYYPVSVFRICKAEHVAKAMDDFDEVISTIPAPNICLTPSLHRFRSVSVWTSSNSMVNCARNTVLCSGQPNVPWYRVANIFDHSTIEWPYNPLPPAERAMLVEKPVDHACTCWRTVLRVGRYGAWSKGKLASHAYFDTLNYLREAWQ